ncbi:hypothetical protein VTJ04DRAFT_7332 [Mycothermus thermophilus]|uniref:uncharacterized protein n=1 Tax=Humicola insolens TaxID=85995 RepID=UPI003742BFFC
MHKSNMPSKVSCMYLTPTIIAARSQVNPRNASTHITFSLPKGITLPPQPPILPGPRSTPASKPTAQTSMPIPVLSSPNFPSCEQHRRSP